MTAGVSSEFKSPQFAQEDSFALVIACSAECSSSRVVENVDWVWEQVADIHSVRRG